MRRYTLRAQSTASEVEMQRLPIAECGAIYRCNITWLKLLLNFGLHLHIQVWIMRHACNVHSGVQSTLAGESPIKVRCEAVLCLSLSVEESILCAGITHT